MATTHKASGTRMFARYAVAAMILFLVPDLARADTEAWPTLRFLDAKKIADRSEGFTEFSGLSLASGGGFWSVGDETARLFRLDERGKVRPEASLAGAKGLEGIAEDNPRGRLLAVREDTSEILSVAGDGTISRIFLPGIDRNGSLRGLFGSGDNNGLEGITVEPESGTVFVLKERNPRLLIEIAADLSAVERILPLTAGLGFLSSHADDDQLDVSGIVWDSRRRGFWITSDTGKAIFFLDLDRMTAKGWMLLNGKKSVANAEGVTLSADGGTLFVVTDDARDSLLLTYGID